MNQEEFEQLIDGSSEGRNAYERLLEFSNFLPSKRVLSDDHFWMHIEPEEQKLFALLTILHLAGSNGMTAVVTQFTSSALAIICLAAETMDEINEPEYASILQRYVMLARQFLSRNKIEFPLCFSGALRKEFSDAGNAFYDLDLYWQIQGQFREEDRALFSCWQSTVPANTLAWIRKNQAIFKRVWCA
jgi:hypothetical protein